MKVKFLIVVLLILGMSVNIIMAQSTYKTARSLYYSGKYNEAINECNTLEKTGKVFYLLACCYSKLGDFEKYKFNLNESANMDFCYAQVEMGLLYIVGGNGFSIDRTKAKYWLNKAIENKEKKDDYMLGAYKFLGNVYYEENNINKAHELWENGATNGSGFLQCWLGSAYLDGEFGYTKNLDKALYWFNIAANNSCKEYKAEALNMLGHIYFNIYNSEEKAANYWEQAIQNGDKTFAAYNLANFHYNYKIIDDDKAFSLYRLSAENGNKEAQYAVGMYYKEGAFINPYGSGPVLETRNYITPNIQEAIKWLQRSADQGYPAAMLDLGLCYEQMYRRNYDERYLRLAAKFMYKASSLGYSRVRKQTSDGGWTDDDGERMKKVTFQTEDPLKLLYEEGVLNANEYESYKNWKDKVIAKLAVDSDVDVNIPQATTANSGTYVLIIANEKYEYEQSVPYAENDGTVFGKYCTGTLGIPERNVHIVVNASLNKMRYELDWLKQAIEVQGGKKIIFYYAGHGIPDEQQKTSYLLPVDGFAKNTSTGFGLTDIYQVLGNLNVETTVLLDACFSGTNRNGDMLVSSRGVAIKAKEVKPQGQMVVISACQGTETAYPYEGQNHGLFTYFVLKKIRETSGNVTLGSLYDFVRDKVSNTSVEVNSKSQTPSVIVSNLIGENWRNIKFKK